MMWALQRGPSGQCVIEVTLHLRSDQECVRLYMDNFLEAVCLREAPGEGEGPVPSRKVEYSSVSEVFLKMIEQNFR